MISRRAVLAGMAAAGGGALAAHADQGGSSMFAQLDQKILQGMQDFSIPGVAVGVILGDTTYARGYGVTDLSNPRPVDTDTVFRIASSSKTFTGTTAMRLVDSGALSLDAPMTRYVPGFRPPAGDGPVTVRQLLNHTPGWLGYDYHDTGTDNHALARYVHDIRNLPQLTPVGQVFSYNNAAISAAGRVIERVTGKTYESSVQSLVLGPLGLTRSTFVAEDITDGNIATPHDIGSDGKAFASPDLLYLPRGCNPFGGLLSSVRDQLAYARFHLGDGRAASGERVMSEQSLQAMRSNPGPGGTLLVELEGFGVSWMLRPTAEGVNVVQHGGDLPGFHSGLMLVPDRRFAITMLTNCNSGPKLIDQVFAEDWALRLFAGLGNLPAVPRQLSAGELAAYEGQYTAQQIGFTGPPVDIVMQLAAADGGLQLTEVGAGGTTTMLTFYKDDFVLYGDTGLRANFLRDADGNVAWFRLGGRLLRHGG